MGKTITGINLSRWAYETRSVQTPSTKLPAAKAKPATAFNPKKVFEAHFPIAAPWTSTPEPAQASAPSATAKLKPGSAQSASNQAWLSAAGKLARTLRATPWYLRLPTGVAAAKSAPIWLAAAALAHTAWSISMNRPRQAGPSDHAYLPVESKWKAPAGGFIADPGLLTSTRTPGYSTPDESLQTPGSEGFRVHDPQAWQLPESIHAASVGRLEGLPIHQAPRDLNWHFSTGSDHPTPPDSSYQNAVLINLQVASALRELDSITDTQMRAAFQHWQSDDADNQVSALTYVPHVSIDGTSATIKVHDVGRFNMHGIQIQTQHKAGDTYIAVNSAGALPGLSRADEKLGSEAHMIKVGLDTAVEYQLPQRRVHLQAGSMQTAEAIAQGRQIIEQAGAIEKPSDYADFLNEKFSSHPVVTAMQDRNLVIANAQIITAADSTQRLLLTFLPSLTRIK